MKKERKKYLVFVYGTLKKGYGNNYLLKNSKFVGMGFTKNKYFMQREGIAFPYALPSDYFKEIPEHYKGHILGEVYEVDERTLERLDMLEGHPNFYQREITTIILEDGTEVQTFIYHYYDFYGEEYLIEPDEHGFIEWNREKLLEVA